VHGRGSSGEAAAARDREKRFNVIELHGSISILHRPGVINALDG
jgi:hypothetical protein